MNRLQKLLPVFFVTTTFLSAAEDERHRMIGIQQRSLYPDTSQLASAPLAHAPGYQVQHQIQPAIAHCYRSQQLPIPIPQQQPAWGCQGIPPQYSQYEQFHVSTPPEHESYHYLSQQRQKASTSLLAHAHLSSSPDESGIDSPTSPHLTGEAALYHKKITQARHHLVRKFNEFLTARLEKAEDLCLHLEEQQSDHFDLEALSEKTRTKSIKDKVLNMTLGKKSINRCSETVKQTSEQNRKDQEPITKSLNEIIGLFVYITRKLNEFNEEGFRLDSKSEERQRKHSQSLSSSSPHMRRRTNSPALQAGALTPPQGYPHQSYADQPRGFQTLSNGITKHGFESADT